MPIGCLIIVIESEIVVVVGSDRGISRVFFERIKFNRWNVVYFLNIFLKIFSWIHIITISIGKILYYEIWIFNYISHHELSEAKSIAFATWKSDLIGFEAKLILIE